MPKARQRNRGTRRSALASAVALLASALIAAAPAAAGTSVDTTATAIAPDGELILESVVDAANVDHPRTARTTFRTTVTGTYTFALDWASTADLRLSILHADGTLLAKKAKDEQPKSLTVSLVAGERYRIKVKAASGVAAFSVFMDTPDVRDYFNEMPKWSDFYYRVDRDTPGVWSDWMPDSPVVCRSRADELIVSTDEFVTFGAKDSLLYPGVLLQGHSLNGGITDLRQLPIRQREPAEISISFLPGDITRTVDEPTPERLAQAVGDIVEEGVIRGFTTGTNVDLRSTRTHSAKQLALDLGLSAKYMKPYLRNRLDMERSGTETTITIYLEETAFTGQMAPPESPQGFFSEHLTQRVLDRHVDRGRLDDASNLPLYVDRVTYGRILVFSLTSSEDPSKISDALQDLRDGVLTLTGEAKTDFIDFVANSEHKVVTVGGDATNATTAITTGDFAEYFTEEPGLTEYVPMSYVIRDLQGDTAFVIDEANHIERECKEGGIRVTVDEMFLESASDRYSSGTNRDEIDFFWVEARPFDGPGEPVFPPEGEAEDVCPWTPNVGDNHPILGENYQQIICWDEEGTESVAEGTVWQPEDAAAGNWFLDIGLSNFDGAEIMFRAGYKDIDPNGSDHIYDPSEWLVGGEIWDDHLPDHDSTYRFRIEHFPAVMDIYLTIELLIDP